MTFPAAHLRRACADAVLAGRVRAQFDVSHVRAVLDRLEAAERECNRLGAEVVALDAGHSALRDALRTAVALLVATGVSDERIDELERIADRSWR